MALTEPKSMEECVYFTNRSIGNGKAMIWVIKKFCPNCKNTIMGKPINKKGKIMIRAMEYTCSSCNYSEPKEVYEISLIANAKYKCPVCGFAGESQIPFKRKNIDGVQTLRFNCGKCNGNIDITKKMKEKC